MFGGLCLAAGGLFLLVDGIGWVPTARFAAQAKPVVAEVVSSSHYHDRHGNEWCCRTTVVVVDTDGSRLTGGLPDSVRYIPDGTVNALYRHGPAYRPVQILPDDEWAVWGGTWVALKSGGTLAGIGVATLLIGSLLRKRSRASA